MHAASMDLRFFRAARYSGSDLPAWRMNQTGVWGTGWRRQARRKGDSLVGAVTQMIVSQPAGTRRPASTASGRGRATNVSRRALPAADPVVRDVAEWAKRSGRAAGAGA